MNRGEVRMWDRYHPILLLDHPDVPEEHRVPVPLELDRPRRRAFLLAGTGLVLQLVLVLDDDAVVPDGDDGVLGLLAGGVEPGRLEVDVVRLPPQRRVAHVD